MPPLAPQGGDTRRKRRLTDPLRIGVGVPLLSVPLEGFDTLRKTHRHPLKGHRQHVQLAAYSSAVFLVHWIARI